MTTNTIPVLSSNYLTHRTNLNNDYFSQETLTSTGESENFTLSASKWTDDLKVTESSNYNTGEPYLYIDDLKGNLFKSLGKIETTETSPYHLSGSAYLFLGQYYLNSGSNELYKDIATTNFTATNSCMFYTDATMKYMINTDGSVLFPTSETPRSNKRNKIRSNLLPDIHSRACPIRDIPENEQIAIEALREEITESEFRKYIKYGFVLVEGQSGKTYQIFRNQSHTKVWKNGKVIEEICVRIKNHRIPPTDNVIAFLNMVQIDEEEFRKMGNLYKMQKAA
jgi:hypothetical protein